MYRFQKFTNTTDFLAGADFLVVFLAAAADFFAAAFLTGADFLELALAMMSFLMIKTGGKWVQIFVRGGGNTF